MTATVILQASHGLHHGGGSCPANDSLSAFAVRLNYISETHVRIHYSGTWFIPGVPVRSNVVYYDEAMIPLGGA